MEDSHALPLFAGYDPADALGAVKPPIHLASAFCFPSAEAAAELFQASHAGAPSADGFIYSRLSNPTLEVAERRLAAFDGAAEACLFSSGMAAISTAVLAWSGPGRAVWGVGSLYGGSDRFLFSMLPEWGIPVRRVAHLHALDDTLAAAGGELPGVIYIETPGNPTMDVHDLRAAVAWARKHERPDHPIRVLVDNTFLGPLLQQPLGLGVDLVLYSATKYLGGHSDVVAGACSGTEEAIARVRSHRHLLGGVLDPFSAWLLARSMETLEIRVLRQQETAGKVLAFLRQHPRVTRLRSVHPADLDPVAADVQAAQTSGHGAMLAFEVAGGREAAFAVLNRLQTVRLAVSLGSTESLATHPASTTHSAIPAEERSRLGIGEGLIRLSVGLEPAEALVSDLARALDAER